MLTPSLMLTIKKRCHAWQVLAVVSLCGLTACGPPGARDLHKGDKLVAHGEFSNAIPVLKQSTEELQAASPAVQARAWNLLGLAYHGTGQLDAASHAYLEAKKLDRNLWDADYNLGCLRMEQSNYPGAIDYLTTYTTSHPKDYYGFVLLGRARVKAAAERTGMERARQLENARLDFDYADKVHGSAEACNGLGLIELQRRYPSVETGNRAMAYFRQALQRDPHYGPALLNLAVVMQTYLNQPHEALALYRQYAALQPAPPDAAQVEKFANKLDSDLRVTIIAHEPAPNPAPVPPATNATPQRPAPAPVQAHAQKPNPAPAPKQAAQQKLPPSTQPGPARATNLAAVERPVPVKPNNRPTPPSATNTSEADTADNTPPPEKKQSFVQKLNPLNWFSHKPKEPETAETPTTTPTPAPTPPPTDVGNSVRYSYPLPVTPIPGDRKEAQWLTNEGHQAEKEGKRAEAMKDYQQAMKADPTCFEAGLALGLAAIDAKDYPEALDALGQALAVQENSADARYAFAWVLGRQGYYQDAANELYKLLTAHPREARAYLLLGNYYAEDLGEPKLAREQYSKALDLLDEKSPQAGAIRAWLEQHPQ